MVPGSTFRYGSSLHMVTLRPRDLSRRPSEEAVRPLPRELDTPPVTKTNLVIRRPPLPRNTSIAKRSDLTELLTRCFEHLPGQRPRFVGDLVTGEQSRDLVHAGRTTESPHRGDDVIGDESFLDDEVMIGLGRDRRQVGHGEDLLMLTE